MVDYQAFLDSINREAYHAGELTWEEDGYTCTRTYHYSPPGCHTSCGLIYYVKDGKVCKIEGDPLDPCANGRLCMRCLENDEELPCEKDADGNLFFETAPMYEYAIERRGKPIESFPML